MSCSICLEKIEKKDCSITECNHTFHTKCLMKWSSNNSTCPVCRFELFKSDKIEDSQIRNIYHDPIDAILDMRLDLIRNNNLIETGSRLIESVNEYSNSITSV